MDTPVTRGAATAAVPPTSPSTTQASVSTPATPTAPPAPPALPAKLVSYEDCLQLITYARENKDLLAKDDALSKLETFFQGRIKRKTAESERDGISAVKRALADGHARFKPTYADKTDATGS